MFNTLFIIAAIVEIPLVALFLKFYWPDRSVKSFTTKVFCSLIFVVLGVMAFVFFGIFYRKLPYEKMYVNETAEEQERLEREAEQAKLQAKIDAKKAEIRARKAKEKEEQNNG